MRSKIGVISVVMIFMFILAVRANAEIGILKDINIGAGDSFPDELANINAILYFSANNGVNGIEIWISDSTPGGTIGIKDILPGGGSSSP